MLVNLVSMPCLVSTYFFFLNPIPNPTPSATPKTTKTTTVTTKQQHHLLRFHTPHLLSTLSTATSHLDGSAFSRYLGGGCSVGTYSGGIPRRDDRGGIIIRFCGSASSSVMTGMEGTAVNELREALELLREPLEPLRAWLGGEEWKPFCDISTGTKGDWNWG